MTETESGGPEGGSEGSDPELDEAESGGPEGSDPELDKTESGEHEGSDSSARPHVKKNMTDMCR